MNSVQTRNVFHRHNRWLWEPLREFYLYLILGTVHMSFSIFHKEFSKDIKKIIEAYILAYNISQKNMSVEEIFKLLWCQKYFKNKIFNTIDNDSASIEEVFNRNKREAEDLISKISFRNNDTGSMEKPGL